MNRLALIILAVCSGLAVTVAGCGTKTNPNFCPNKNPDDNCTEPDVCMDNSHCAAPTGVCNTQTMACVQCTPAAASACVGASPICGTDNSCHGCTTHAECTGSNLCLADGSCASPDMVAYVAAAPGGTDNPTCSFASPCTHVAAALATGRPYVRFHGTIDEPVVIGSRRVATIFADPGAKLTNSSGGAILTVQDDGTSLNVYDLTISDAPNNANGFGVLIPTGGAPTVSLTRVTLANNPARGLSVAGGTLTVSHSTISSNTGGGVVMTGGSLTMSQTTITGNAGGGISLMGGVFAIVGNVFFNNGTDSGFVGGLTITTTLNSANRLEFNSFNRNKTQDGLGTAIQCVAGAFTARNNILSENATATNTLQFSGTCMHAYSIVRPGVLPAGATNKAGDPLFKDTTAGDLHIQPGSAAIGGSDPASDLTGIASQDIDGDIRRSPADIGADQR
jgi:hypothetical protein